MKRERFLSCLYAAAIAWLLSVGAVGCLATAFGMALSIHVWAVLAILSLVFALCCCFRFGGAAAFGVAALASVYLWRESELSLQLEALVREITFCYNQGYGWPVLRWSEESLTDVEVVLPFIVIGSLIALTTAWVVNRKARSFWAILAIAPVVTLCVILNDTVPAAAYLAATIFAVVLLLMTQSLRKRDEAGGNRLVGMLALPLAAALAVLFMAVPREGYAPPPEDLAQRVVTWFQEAEMGQDLVNQVMSFFSGMNADQVDLKNSGPRGNQKYKVMEVTAEDSGQLYLRGRAYDSYDGRQWLATEGEWALDDDYIRGTFRGEVRLQTEGVHDVLYFPMNAGASATDSMYEGYVSNADRLKEYAYSWYSLSGERYFVSSSYILSSDDSGVTDIVSGAEVLMEQLVGQYLELPEDVRTAAESYLRENMPKFEKRPQIEPKFTERTMTVLIDGKIYELPAAAQEDVLLEADFIRELVRNSASYDLKTKKMPFGESDFAMWFLEDSDTGYCVHFATAATVLLRAAGIPARYVEGYLVTAKAGQTVTVRGEDAHAWVEYWVPGYGWQLLEATPSAGGGEAEETTETTTEPEEATEPEETDVEAEDTTEASEATDPSRPEPTRPDTGGSGGDETTAPTEGGLPGIFPGGEGNGERIDLSWLLPILGWVLRIALLVGALWGQWKFRVKLLDRWLTQGSANEQALRRWREMKFLCTLLGVRAPPELEDLALKAKFSQYTLDTEELERFIRARADLVTRMRAEGWHKRILYRLILAIW